MPTAGTDSSNNDETLIPTASPSFSPDLGGPADEYCDSGLPQCDWAGSNNLTVTLQFALTKTAVATYAGFQARFEQAVRDAASGAQYLCERCRVPVAATEMAGVELGDVRTHELAGMSALKWADDSTRRRRLQSQQLQPQSQLQLRGSHHRPRPRSRSRSLQSQPQAPPNHLRIQIRGSVPGQPQAAALAEYAGSDAFADAFFDALLAVNITDYESCRQQGGGVACALSIGPPIIIAPPPSSPSRRPHRTRA